MAVTSTSAMSRHPHPTIPLAATCGARSISFGRDSTGMTCSERPIPSQLYLRALKLSLKFLLVRELSRSEMRSRLTRLVSHSKSTSIGSEICLRSQLHSQCLAPSYPTTSTVLMLDAHSTSLTACRVGTCAAAPFLRNIACSRRPHCGSTRSSCNTTTRSSSSQEIPMVPCQLKALAAGSTA